MTLPWGLYRLNYHVDQLLKFVKYFTFFYSVPLIITEEKLCLPAGNGLVLLLPGDIKALLAIRLPCVLGYVCLNGAMSVCALTPGSWHGVFLVHSLLKTWHGRAKWAQLGPCSHGAALIRQNKVALYNPSTNEVMALSIYAESALMSPVAALRKWFSSLH